MSKACIANGLESRIDYSSLKSKVKENEPTVDKTNRTKPEFIKNLAGHLWKMKFVKNDFSTCIKG